jgi:hypothetical protein
MYKSIGEYLHRGGVRAGLVPRGAHLQEALPHRRRARRALGPRRHRRGTEI